MSFRVVLTTVSMADRAAFERMCTDLGWVALPAEQEASQWRIQTCPDSLCYTPYRGPYYGILLYSRVNETVDLETDMPTHIRVGVEKLVAELRNVHYIAAVFALRLEAKGYEVTRGYDPEGRVELRGSNGETQVGLEIGGGVV